MTKIIFKSFFIFNIVLLSISFNANAKCGFNCKKIIKHIEKVTDNFQPNFGIPNALSYKSLNNAFCAK